MTQSDLNYIWTNTDVQIEEGTTSTEFEEYKGGTTRIDMTDHDPLMCVDDTCDYIDFKTKKIVRYVKKIVFDKNNDILCNQWDEQDSVNTKGIWCKSNMLLGTYNNSYFNNNKGLSNYFKNLGSAFAVTDIIRFGVSSESSPPYISFRIPIDLDWDNWLTEQNNKGTPLTVYIVLREPEYEDINLPDIDLYGSYHLFATDGNISSNIEIIN